MGSYFIPIAAPVGYIASQLMQHKDILAIWHHWGALYIITGWIILTVLAFLLASWMEQGSLWRLPAKVKQSVSSVRRIRDG